MNIDVSSAAAYQLASSLSENTQSNASGGVDGAGADGTATSAGSGDTVNISEEGRQLAVSSATAGQADEASDESENAAGARVKQRIKDVQAKIKELQEQIRAVEEENLSEKQKQQKIQQLQDQLAQYQAQLADLQRALYGSSGNPGGTRAEGMSSSLT